ncbi:MAG TPA: ferrous iron transport protein B, partial [Clostridiales bacterium]|nr:ferrous iron transport protein B [Clostridiales bacterium]
MGLTYQSSQFDSMKDIYKIDKKEDQFIVALAGNPNTGKSTVFNSLTGLRQHTGNWPGKTVVNARGDYNYLDKEFILIDLPGIYSLFVSSSEEEVARDFICYANPDVVVVVADATCLERNLNLVFQIMELTNKVILCINLIDEAKKKNIIIDRAGIEKQLGIPVVMCAARSNLGMNQLKEEIYNVVMDKSILKPQVVMYQEYIEEKVNEVEPYVENNFENINSRWLALRMIDANERKTKEIRNIRDDISGQIYKEAEEISDKYIRRDKERIDRDRKIDDIVTSRKFGIPLMILSLALILWITIVGANYASEILSSFLFKIEGKLARLLEMANVPTWIYGLLILGLYRTLAWVISVMLPPMAIFFPLFTLLEDLGYLPRVAFNLDHYFKKACAHGKQCLSMCMGLGCNAAGVIACRIIESPREKLIAILTNNFVPCNGRFPILIAISSMCFITIGGIAGGTLPVISVTAIVILGILITLLVSYGLSKTILKGVPSSFTLELPPYRRPQIGRVLYTSLIDRTIFVLGRAIVVAAPAGMLIWILANVYIGQSSVIAHAAGFLDPFARVIGLDGFILMAFILGLPANEIVLPILLMAYLSTGEMVEMQNLDSLRGVLVDNGWTLLTALNTMLFSLFHWPCATTLMTIKKETASVKWTVLAAVIPTAIAIIICFITSTVFRLLGWG